MSSPPCLQGRQKAGDGLVWWCRERPSHTKQGTQAGLACGCHCEEYVCFLSSGLLVREETLIWLSLSGWVPVSYGWRQAYANIEHNADEQFPGRQLWDLRSEHRVFPNCIYSSCIGREGWGVASQILMTTEPFLSSLGNSAWPICPKCPKCVIDCQPPPPILN